MKRFSPLRAVASSPQRATACSQPFILQSNSWVSDFPEKGSAMFKLGERFKLQEVAKEFDFTQYITALNCEFFDKQKHKWRASPWPIERKRALLQRIFQRLPNVTDVEINVVIRDDSCREFYREVGAVLASRVPMLRRLWHMEAFVSNKTALDPFLTQLVTGGPFSQLTTASLSARCFLFLIATQQGNTQAATLFPALQELELTQSEGLLFGRRPAELAQSDSDWFASLQQSIGQLPALTKLIPDDPRAISPNMLTLRHVLLRWIKWNDPSPQMIEQLQASLPPCVKIVQVQFNASAVPWRTPFLSHKERHPSVEAAKNLQQMEQVFKTVSRLLTDRPSIDLLTLQAQRPVLSSHLASLLKKHQGRVVMRGVGADSRERGIVLWDTAVNVILQADPSGHDLQVCLDHVYGDATALHSGLKARTLFDSTEAFMTALWGNETETADIRSLYVFKERDSSFAGFSSAFSLPVRFLELSVATAYIDQHDPARGLQNLPAHLLPPGLELPDCNFVEAKVWAPFTQNANLTGDQCVRFLSGKLKPRAGSADRAAAALGASPPADPLLAALTLGGTRDLSALTFPGFGGWLEAEHTAAAIIGPAVCACTRLQLFADSSDQVKSLLTFLRDARQLSGRRRAQLQAEEVIVRSHCISSELSVAESEEESVYTSAFAGENEHLMSSAAADSDSDSEDSDSDDSEDSEDSDASDAEEMNDDIVVRQALDDGVPERWKLIHPLAALFAQLPRLTNVECFAARELRAVRAALCMAGKKDTEVRVSR